ncbi:MAG: geranylgeranylglyceryl/heptaprenylglyceryl phosphate synthase [Bacteroidetes bacterium]|nr:geranylgeranylglyceryl/heptaprenylglyceryl phosphate synthase [Bacteroidota bacterium]
MAIYEKLTNIAKTGKKQLAVLIDPDKANSDSISSLIKKCNSAKVDLILVGGSLIKGSGFESCIQSIKNETDIPVVIFPGSVFQISSNADAILLLSLISGRNPEMLIGNHVIAAPHIRRAGIEVIPCGYMLIESGKLTSVVYMSNTSPIPYEKNDIAVCTAVAGEMLGHKLIYMDAGSGAEKSISAEMIKQVKANISIPLIVGGGIRDVKTAHDLWNAGADVVVIGNACESKPGLIEEIRIGIGY